MKITKSISLDLEMVEVIDEFIKDSEYYDSFSDFVRNAIEEKLYNTI